MLRFALFYVALIVGANAAFAGGLDALRVGEMKRLTLEDPAPVSAASFSDEAGVAHSLADWRGKVVLLNLWSVTCMPCREEMPALNTLQRDIGWGDFAVVPVAFGYNRIPAVERFFEKYKVTDLPVLLDPERALSADMGVMAAPVSILIDRQGNEIGRLVGGADWSTPEAKALIEALIAQDAG
jgi:thiol-disulfide isomerase/thioredoxin